MRLDGGALQVRNNIMVALTDMTVQYTVLVDAHIPRLAACLADPNELVRRQALALLATLLSRVSLRLPERAACTAHSHDVARNIMLHSILSARLASTRRKPWRFFARGVS